MCQPYRATTPTRPARAAEPGPVSLAKLHLPDLAAAGEAHANDSGVCSGADDSCASDSSSLLNGNELELGNAVDVLEHVELEHPGPKDTAYADKTAAQPSPSSLSSSSSALSLFLATHGLRLAAPLRLLGTGAAGRVDLVHVPLPAEGPPLPAARKTLPRSRDPHMRAREDAAFAREVEALAAGRVSPFVVRVLGVAAEADRHELLMELAEGDTLERELTAALDSVRGEPSQPLLPPARIASLAASLLSGLHALHRAGFAHLDIKPANLLLTPRGSLLLGDAGCAQRAGPDGALSGPFAGTPLFAAPEAKRAAAPQAPLAPPRGAPAAPASSTAVTVKADMYSVGVLLAVCAAWHRQTGRVLAFLRGQAALPAYVPGPLRELICSLVAEDANARPSAAEALAHPFLAGVDLERLVPVRCEGAAPR